MIPKVLHQFWVGPPMPAAYRRFGEDWRRLHPAWDYRFWSEENLPRLRNQALYDAAAGLWPTAKNSQCQFKSDVLRYELLEQFGGVWADVDCEPRKPLDKLLDGIEAFVAWEVQDAHLRTAIVGGVPGHRFWRRVIDGLPAQVARRAELKGTPEISGPQYITRLYREDRGGLTVFDAPLFYPYLWRRDEMLRWKERSYRHAYVIHHWNDRRTRKGWAL